MLKLLALICLIYFVSETSAIKCATIAVANETYWTAERMASAIPRDMIYPGNSTVDAFDCTPYSITMITDRSIYLRYPECSVGKVFFRLGNTNYVCSASIGSDRLVWTAGHCVFDRLSSNSVIWATQWAFVPGYNNGFEPYKRYNAISVCTSDEFEANGWSTGGIAFDYGLAVFPKYEFAYYEFESFDLAIKRSPASQFYESNGYPQGAPFNGAWNNQCLSPGCKRATGLTGPEPVGISCSSTGGSSGGPWIILPQDTTSGVKFKWQIAGVNSFKYNNDNDHMYSPFFDEKTEKFWDDAVKMFPHD